MSRCTAFKCFSIALWVSIIDGHSLSDKMHHDCLAKCNFTRMVETAGGH